jgi:hypothetical protein
VLSVTSVVESLFVLMQPPRLKISTREQQALVAIDEQQQER